MLSGSTTPTSTAPDCSPAGFTLIVTGTNFVNGGSVVNWNGSPRSTAYVQPTDMTGKPNGAPYLTAVISYTDAVTAGTFTVTVSNGFALSNSKNFSVTAPGTKLPAPFTKSLSPTSAAVGSGAFNLVVTGTNFLTCSAIQWNGTGQATNYLSDTQLSTLIPAMDLTSAGTAQVTVFTPPQGNPPQGGGTSGAISFTVLPPTITALSASTTQMPSTPYCSPVGFTLTVTGTNFVNGQVVNWNGSPRPTTFVSATQLNAEITYADTAFPGPVTVLVSGAGTSTSSLPFSLTAPSSLPVPSIGKLMPANAAAGGAAFVLSVIGNNLLPCSAVNWGAGALTTTFVGSTGITAPVPAADIATVGNVPVTVTTPAPSGCTPVPMSGITCGGTSNASTFTVFMPAAAAMRTAAAVQLASSADIGTGGLLSLPLMSSDHRYAVHVLASIDGISEIPGTAQNVFVRDTCQGASSGCAPSIALASIGLSSNPADGDSISPSISADGRYVAFLSSARNLVESDTNGVTDVFIRDTCAGVPSGCAPSTQLVSVATDG